MSLQLLLGVSQNTDTDGGTGLLSVTQFDCFDRHVAGVSFAASPPGEAELYTYNHLPASGQTVTSSEGAGVFVNVPAGGVNVTSTLPPGPTNDGGTRALQSVTVVVRHGSITLVELRPRAR